MPKKIQISVIEDEKELRLLLTKTTTERVRGRIKALLLLKQGKANYQSQLATKLGFTEKTIREWLKLYRSEGLSSLLTVRVRGNRRSTFSKEILAFIKTQLSNPQTTITSYVELQQRIENTFGGVINYKTLHGYCNRVFKSKLKVSRKSHYKKDEQVIEAFKKTTKDTI
ncbi:MAG: transposase [Tenacibaculum sp.]